MNDHGGNCVCYDCSGRREMERISEHQGVSYDNYGNGHSTNCVCEDCSGRREKRHQDIEDRYPRRW